MTATNGYASGRAWESVGYMTNGEADDWEWRSMLQAPSWQCHSARPWGLC